MLGQIKTKPLILFLALVIASISLPRVGLAQSETPYDLVDAVNNLRALHGLEPYKIDPGLMAYAQEHSEYLAARQAGTHRHSDGSLPQDIGLQENVASGDARIVTVAIVVYEIWVDWGHRHTLTGYSTGAIGAGIALSENGQVYYTVDIRPGAEAETIDTQAGTSAPLIPLATSTPGENGAIIHIVGYGQTLWGIARSYGVSVDDIRRLNGMAADSTLINLGQQLLIRPASTVTPVPSDETPPVAAQTLSDTAIPFTETMAPTETAMPSPSFSVSPSPLTTVVPTSTPSDPVLKNRRPEAVVALTIGIIGLLVVAIFGFRRSNNDKNDG